MGCGYSFVHGTAWRLHGWFNRFDWRSQRDQFFRSDSKLMRRNARFHG